MVSFPLFVKLDDFISLVRVEGMELTVGVFFRFYNFTVDGGFEDWSEVSVRAIVSLASATTSVILTPTSTTTRSTLTKSTLESRDHSGA